MDLFPKLAGSFQTVVANVASFSTYTYRTFFFFSPKKVLITSVHIYYSKKDTLLGFFFLVTARISIISVLILPLVCLKWLIEGFNNELLPFPLNYWCATWLKFLSF